MNVVFYERNYAQKLNPTAEISVERYSTNMVGGPERAYLTAPAMPEMWELMKLLRCPVEIYGSDGRLNWWGYVNRVVVPHGAQRVGLGLDNLNNYILCDYDGGTTAVASNATSIAEYGQKEKRLDDPNGTQTDAERYRDMYLADREYAHPEIEFSGGQNTVQIECYGWYKSLEWKYYTSTDTSNVEHTTQISNIVAATGQFLRGTIVENLANLTSSAERDGKRTGLDYISEFLSAGTSNVRPLLVRADKDRYLHVYERRAETVEYLLLDDGTLVTNMNLPVPAEYCLSAKWVQVKDLITSVAKSTMGMHPFFIESAEYDAGRDHTTYRVAGAFDQTRLSKYVEETTHPPVEEYPPYYPPPTGGGSITDYAAVMIDGGTKMYDLSSNITLTVTGTTTRVCTFTTSVAGLYMVGGQAYASRSSDQSVAITIDGLADYANNIQSLTAVSDKLAYGCATAISLTDYLPISQQVTITFTCDDGDIPDTLYCFVVRLL